MLDAKSPLTALRHALGTGKANLREVAEDALAHANGNASRNTYLHLSEQGLLEEAEVLSKSIPNSRFRPPLYGVPISLKDCFDLKGTITTCGTRFYAAGTAPAEHDSAMAHVLRGAGALITGKTHLHALAYGITGQNPDFGDCLQPRDPALLTGGSSSGAAASVQEGSALAAIGTDTGGSIRVPAALCGLTGFRASRALAYGPGPWRHSAEGLWDGAYHLAKSFDTPGFFVRDARDAPPIAKALLGIPLAAAPHAPRIGFVHEDFLHDAEPEVMAAFNAWRRRLVPSAAFLEAVNPSSWAHSQEIFSGIQAAEAAALHAGHFDEFEPAVAQRLHWGAAFTQADVQEFHRRLELFRGHAAHLFRQFDVLMLPAAPVSRLYAAQDQGEARKRILRYTTPFSLMGAPAISLPGESIGAGFGTGVQLAAAPGKDAALLAFAAQVTQSLAAAE